MLEARDGAEGLAKARSSRPDAIVADINMPVMDGYEMCHAVRRDESLKLIPVILLTMLSDPRDVIRGLNAGADAYVTKPYNVPTLVSHIESLVSKPPAPAPEVERRKVEIRLAGETHVVDAHGPRMLNLLVSTYENAMLQNRTLIATQRALEDVNRHLEDKVLEQSAALRESEQRFRSLIGNASDLLAVVDAKGTIAYMSPSIKKLGGYEVDEVLGRKFLEFAHPEDRAGAAANLADIVRNPYVIRTRESRFRHKEGNWITLESIAHNALADPAVKGIVVNARDITERKRSEKEMLRLTFALRAFSQSNSALVHAQSETELLRATCDAIAGAGAYPLAWVGIAKHDTGRTVEPVASAGEAIGYLEGLEVSWGDLPLCLGPIGMAIRSGATQVSDDLATNPEFSPGIEKARAYGLACSISLPIRASSDTVGVLMVYGTEPNSFREAEVKLFEELAGDLGYGLFSRRTRKAYEAGLLERERAAENLRATFESMIAALAATVEMRDPYTAGHERRVAELASAIGSEMGLDESRIEGLHFAAIIHDIGKINIPAEILVRPGKLTPAEFEIIKTHCQAGHEVVKGIQFPWPVSQIILQHHERLDGSGYPQGLKGGDILLESRILTVADVVEAMSSHRPYRPSLGIEPALQEIEDKRGRYYDPQAVDACLRLFREKRFALEMS